MPPLLPHSNGVVVKMIFRYSRKRKEPTFNAQARANQERKPKFESQHRDHGFRGVDDECKANTRRYVRGDEILKVNANTEYLRRFLHGSSDKELFKKNVLVVTYEDVRPYIERVVNGEPTNLISGEPIIHFFQRAGPENSEA
ncbi:hypothetical protein YC2023_075320 [Brassica napus]